MFEPNRAMLARMIRRLAPGLAAALVGAALAAAFPLTRPAMSFAEDKPGGAAPKADEKPKEDPSKLPEDEKKKKLDELNKLWEENRRNQDLVPVRTRRNAIKFVGDMRYPPSGAFLKKTFEDDRDMTTRIAALVAIGKCGDQDTIEFAVKRALTLSKDQPVFASTLPRMFAGVQVDSAREFLITRLPQKEDDVNASLIDAIGESRWPAAVPVLLQYWEKNKDVAVRFEILRAIGKCDGKAGRQKLLSALADTDWRIRMGAVEGIGFGGDPGMIPELRRCLIRGEEPIVAETAVEAIARIGTRDAVEPLIDSLKVGRLRARQKARAALKGLAKSLFEQEKDYHVDPNLWTSWWKKVKDGINPDDPAYKGSETASYFKFPIQSDRVLFILDVSGSMKWPDAPDESGIKPADWKERRIDKAHKELFKALRDLAKQNRGKIPAKHAKSNDTSDLPTVVGENGEEPPTLFNVATFAGVVTPWQKSAVLASEENVEAAIKWLEVQFPRGGTATFDALAFGLAQPEIDTIYFLSDGVPSLGRFEERETILSEVRKLNRFRRVTIHTVALIIGLSPIESARKYEDPDDMADIMSRIASENQGEFANESK